jgi:hypothetical protein
MATAAARHYPEVIAFWLEILHAVHKGSKKKYSTAERLEAPDRIMAYRLWQATACDYGPSH